MTKKILSWIAIAVGAGLLLVAVAAVVSWVPGNTLQKAEGVRPEGSEYDVALFTEYLQQSKQYYLRREYTESDQFAVKALASAIGATPGPDEIGSRYLPPDRVGSLATARDQLVKAQAMGGAKVVPLQTARAQVMFDCWLAEAADTPENAMSSEHADSCRAHFVASIDRVEAQLSPAPRLPSSVLVFWNFSETTLTSEAMDILNSVVAIYQQTSARGIQVIGHTDTVGPATENLVLSRRRAETVKDVLVSLGIPTNAIRTEGRGESEPLVPTGDNVAEPQNRRVEVEILPSAS